MFRASHFHPSAPLFAIILSLAEPSNRMSVVMAQLPDEKQPMWNFPTKTLGGAQAWTDYRIRDGYRLQQNALTGHWRVLDDRDMRRAWGSRPACLSTLDGLRPSKSDGQPSGSLANRPTVVLLHGLMRTHRSMTAMQKVLADQGGYDTINFGYASSRRTITDHAAALREVLEDQPSHQTFAFVGHSMGNVVVRHLIGDLVAGDDAQQLLPRMKSMVMLGPPNQGAMIARRLAATGLFGIVTGPGGMELGPRFEDLQKRLGTPSFPFAVVAGDVSSSVIQNPLTDGAGDFVVGVDEAKLEGAAEFKTVSRVHSFLMDAPEVQSFVLDFFDRSVRSPLPASEPSDNMPPSEQPGH